MYCFLETEKKGNPANFASRMFTYKYIFTYNSHKHSILAKTSAIHTTQAAERKTMKEEGFNDVGRSRKLKMRPNSRNTQKTTVNSTYLVRVED